MTSPITICWNTGKPILQKGIATHELKKLQAMQVRVSAQLIGLNMQFLSYADTKMILLEQHSLLPRSNYESKMNIAFLIEWNKVYRDNNKDIAGAG